MVCVVKGRTFNIDAEIKFTDGRYIRFENATLYIHFKGEDGSRTTHLDLKHPDLFESLPVRRGGIYVKVRANEKVIEMIPSKHNSKLFGLTSIKIEVPEIIAFLFKGEKGYVWLCAKEKGLQIGLKRSQAKKLKEGLLKVSNVIQ